MASKTPQERAIDAVLRDEMRKLNTHLPRKRRTLHDLLNDEAPAVETVGGGHIFPKKDELARLAAEVPDYLQSRIRLPFVLLRRMDLGKSIFTVSGERIEEFAVKWLLGLTSLDFRRMPEDTEPLYLYRAQVAELIHRFHSLVVIGFGLPKELEN